MEMLYDQIKTPSDVRMFYMSRDCTSEPRYFFSRDTMRFFGDTMRSYGIKRLDGVVYMYRKPSASVNVFGRTELAGSNNNFLSIWRLDPETYDLRPVRDHSIQAQIYGFAVTY
jgi:hypothetical protein